MTSLFITVHGFSSPALKSCKEVEMGVYAPSRHFYYICHRKAVPVKINLSNYKGKKYVMLLEVVCEICLQWSFPQFTFCYCNLLYVFKWLLIRKKERKEEKREREREIHRPFRTLFSQSRANTPATIHFRGNGHSVDERLLAKGQNHHSSKLETGRHVGNGPIKTVLPTWSQYTQAQIPLWKPKTQQNYFMSQSTNASCLSSDGTGWSQDGQNCL